MVEISYPDFKTHAPGLRRERHRDDEVYRRRRRSNESLAEAPNQEGSGLQRVGRVASEKELVAIVSATFHFVFSQKST